MRREETELAHLAEGEDKWRTVVRFPSHAGKFLSSEEIFPKYSAIRGLVIRRTCGSFLSTLQYEAW